MRSIVRSTIYHDHSLFTMVTHTKIRTVRLILTANTMALRFLISTTINALNLAINDFIDQRAGTVPAFKLQCQTPQIDSIHFQHHETFVVLFSVDGKKDQLNNKFIFPGTPE